MGVVNTTPDSFFDGGRCPDAEAAVRLAWRLAEEGADLIDVGGESSRPGAAPVSEAEELARVLPVLRELAPRLPVPLSVDTAKPGVARAALAEGAEIVNDIGGLRDEAMWRVVADAGAAVVAMHMRGTPRDMQARPPAADIMVEIKSFFANVLQLPLPPHTMILDPGIGFGKTVQQNLIILNRLAEFGVFRRPILVGTSRKSYIGAITGRPAADRLPGSLAAAVLAVAHGARIVRCHDVAATRQALQVAAAIRREGAE
jgi:dihydropteroate synthase